VDKVDLAYVAGLDFLDVVPGMKVSARPGNLWVTGWLSAGVE
jgi:hypothetical protein